MNVLDLPMGPNDAKAATIRDYLKALLATLWREEEGFSGKRPFGNSGWKHEVSLALVKAGVVSGEVDADGYLDDCNDAEVDAAIQAAITSLT